MCEDGEEDAIHGGSVLENAHGSGPSPDFSETPFDGVGGSHGLSLLKGLVAKAGEQLAEVGPEAIDGFGIDLLPAVGEAASGRVRLGEGFGVHDGVAGRP